ncbi:MAG: hypothetical protein AAGC47_08995, partial [Bacteroidota bacterium]
MIKAYLKFLLIGIIAIPMSSAAQVSATFKVEMPQNRMYVDAGYNQEYSEQKSIYLGGQPSAFGGSGDYTFKWSPAHLLDDPYSPNPEVIRLDQSTYFKLKVKDLKTGCELEDEVVVFYPTSKSKEKEVEIELFPNPFQEIVQFRSNESIQHLTVLDLTGRVVQQAEFDKVSNATILTERFN